MENLQNQNSKQKTKTAFAIIELVIAITIIAVLSTMGTMVYTSSLQSSRDAKRKADIEQLRSALELYRSNSGTSKYPSTILSVTGYIKVPKDSKNNKEYGYQSTADGNDYTLGTKLEKVNGPTCAVVPSICWTLNSPPSPARCDYCIGPYGTK